MDSPANLDLDMFKNADGTYTLPDGIYFGLPDKVYHGDTGALGSTSIVELASKPCLWQYDRLRPKKEVEPEFLTWGHAWHCRVLEGKEAFDQRYARLPTPVDFPGCMVTVEEVKEFLRFKGEKLTGNKPELVARAKQHDDCPPVFDDLMAQWRAKHPDYVELKPGSSQEIEDAVANMGRDPTMSAVMQAGSLIDGAAELSIFYTEGGVRRKARFDYGLGPAGARKRSLVVDLKSFTTFKGGSNEDAAIRKLYDQCYDVQAAYYRDAFRAAKGLCAAGKVFGPAPRDGYLESFLSAPAVDWIWVMMRRDAGMIPVILSIDADDRQIDHAKAIVDHAIDSYQRYVAEFGLDQLWTPPPSVPLRLNASLFPTYNRGLIYEQPPVR